MKGGKMDKTDKEIIGILKYEIVKKFRSYSYFIK